jgi:hypothetical protein
MRNMVTVHIFELYLGTQVVELNTTKMQGVVCQWVELACVKCVFWQYFKILNYAILVLEFIENTGITLQYDDHVQGSPVQIFQRGITGHLFGSVSTETYPIKSQMLDAFLVELHSHKTSHTACYSSVSDWNQRPWSPFCKPKNCTRVNCDHLAVEIWASNTFFLWGAVDVLLHTGLLNLISDNYNHAVLWWTALIFIITTKLVALNYLCLLYQTQSKLSYSNQPHLSNSTVHRLS